VFRYEETLPSVTGRGGARPAYTAFYARRKLVGECREELKKLVRALYPTRK
jgi:hypothetical protein